MSACNQQPPPEHPFHATGVACHMSDGHEGPHTWECDPSPARRGLDALLRVMPTREIESVDSQPAREVHARVYRERGVGAPESLEKITDLPAGPWLLVSFVGGDQYAVWKRTGTVYRVGQDGAVDEDPLLVLKPAEPAEYATGKLESAEIVMGRLHQALVFLRSRCPAGDHRVVADALASYEQFDVWRH